MPHSKIITKSEQETRQIGKKIAGQLKGGDIVLLQGDLGAGKTAMVKGVAEGLGIAEEITSPTFVLMNVYEIKSLKSKIKSLIHVDTYRLKNEQELLDIGVEDYLGKPDTVCVIEWPEKIMSLIKNKKTMLINIEHGEKENERVIDYENPNDKIQMSNQNQNPNIKFDI